MLILPNAGLSLGETEGVFVFCLLNAKAACFVQVIVKKVAAKVALLDPFRGDSRSSDDDRLVLNFPMTLS